MTPLHLAPNITLIHGDCLEYMATLADGAYSLCVVDPPYGIGEDGGDKMRGRKADNHRKVVNHKKKGWDKRPPSAYWELIGRVSINQVVWGGNYFTDFLPPKMGWVFWNKLIGGDFSDGELAWTSFDRALRMFTYSYHGDTRGGHDRIHPTQKPIPLYRFILQNYARPGDTILDTHLGSGSSAIAAWEMGYTFTGIEIDRDYFDAAVERIKKRMLQPYLPGIGQPKAEQTTLF